MGLTSLFLFTLLGGLAAGLYAAETFLRRTREGDRPWLISAVAVVLFAVGLIAAATHISSIPRAFESLFSGTINFGSGMIWEVVVSVVFLVLAAIDLVLSLMKKETPFVLRAITAVAAVAAIILMGTAYVSVYGNAVWTNALATVLAFLAGGLSMGLALFALLAGADYSDKKLRITSLVVNAVLVVGLGLEVAAFMAAGFSPVTQVVALIIAPVVSLALVDFSSKIENKKFVAIAICVATLIGVAVARYAFYATCTVL